MAHNLNFNEQTGQYSFYSLKEKAWHGFGQISSNQLTSREVLIESQLAYPVSIIPSTYRLPSGEDIVSDTSFATFREDTKQILGEGLSKDYHIVQNVDAFTFFDSITQGEGIIYETAGALGKGERIFITAKLPSYIKVGNNDYIEQYLFLTTSHDGKESITVGFTPIRIVCNNTLTAALSNCSNVVRIRHTASATQQLRDAHKVMGMVNTLSPLMEQAFNQWAKVKITDRELQRLIQIAMAPNKETLINIREGKDEENSSTYKNQVFAAFGYALKADSQQLDTTKGTLFGAFNAMTGYFQNVRSYKDDETKIDSLFCGGTAAKKAQTTFDICLNYAKHGADALILN